MIRCDLILGDIKDYSFIFANIYSIDCKLFGSVLFSSNVPAWSFLYVDIMTVIKVVIVMYIT